MKHKTHFFWGVILFFQLEQVLFIKVCAVTLNHLSNIASTAIYSWGTPRATVLTGGDLQWALLPFQFVKGSTIH